LLADSALYKASRINTCARAESKQLKPDENEHFQAYAGTFTVDHQAKTVTHHVEMSWDESRTGKDQVRRFKLEGNTLKLTTDPSIDPATGEKTICELIWHRD
jgi:hypothetical protein